MNYEELISDANLAFAGNQFEVSLKKAQEAINKDDSKAEGVCVRRQSCALHWEVLKWRNTILRLLLRKIRTTETFSFFLDNRCPGNEWPFFKSRTKA